jgi:hypothetical protein
MPALKARLPDILGRLGSGYHVPLVAVLAEPTPEVRLSAGSLSARRVLNELVASAPEYRWELRNSVVYIYRNDIEKDSNFFLHWKIKSFTISDTVADVELRLRAHLNKMRKGVEGAGGLMVGLRSSQLAPSAHDSAIRHNPRRDSS